VGEIGQGGGLPVAFRARQIHDDFLGLVVQFLFFLLDGAVGMQELVGDVGENGGAPRGHAAFGRLDEEAGKEFAQVFGRAEMGEAAEEVFGEVVEIARGLRGGGGELPAEMARTKT